jgi:hypothetical protein
LIIGGTLYISSSQMPFDGYFCNTPGSMKNKIFLTVLLLCAFTLVQFSAQAQCSICTRTAQQLGEKPAQNLNAGILYLAAAPLAICGVLGFRWWRKNNSAEA